MTSRVIAGDEMQSARMSREALSQLLKVIESKVSSRVSIFEEVSKLMSRLDLTADFAEFSRFYDFVFFICRENGQRSITVNRAIMAWRLVLVGRFRLLNQWCKFVEENQRHNISEDTWRQVLAFSRCVHENLEGYNPEGAWPILIDEFAEYMYRTKGSQAAPNIFCNCGDSEPLQCEDALSGLKILPGSKRKSSDDLQMDEDFPVGSSSYIANSKKMHFSPMERFFGWGQNQFISTDDEQGNAFGCLKCPCSVEGCLSKGFAGLLSDPSRLQFNQDRRVSYT